MKDHCKMRLNSVNKVQEVLLQKAGSDDSVQMFPKHNGAVPRLMDRRYQFFCTGRRAFQQKPAVTFSLRQNIKIPTQTAACAFSTGRDGESSTLRKRGGLEPHA